MKRTLYSMLAVVFMAILSLVGIGCVPLEQATETRYSTMSPSSPSLSGTGTVEVHITDAPPEEQVTSVLLTVSKVEIHKAGGNNGAEPEQEQEKQQTQAQIQQKEKRQEQKTERTNDKAKPENKQSKPVNNGKKPEEPSGETERVQGQEKQKEDGDGGSWITIKIAAGTTFDLLKIKGLEELFAVSQVEAGKYTQVRMIVDKVEVWLGGKKAEDVKLPSGELKLMHPFEVVAGESTVILLDFDAGKSVNVTGGGKVMVKPVVKMDVKQKPAAKPSEAKKVTQEDSQKIAEQFVKTDETFAFDGVADTLKLNGTEQGKYSYCWSFTFEFDSRQAGYGNRTSQVLAQVITHHKAVITVEQGKVTSAIMDGKWDMVKEKEVSAQTGVVSGEGIFF